MVNPKHMATMNAIESFEFPLFESNFAALEAVESINIHKQGIDVYLKLGLKAHSKNNLIAMALADHLAQAGLANAKVHVRDDVLPSPNLARSGQLKNVKNIVMVASGKGGVGKSTTAVNLALALRTEGANVGILDADIYGPSMRTMLGVDDAIKPELVDQKYVQPICRFGLKSMSVAYMSQQKTPMIWRGPMATKALQQLLEMTLWGELDYLIVDMPPGTGDIHISLAQKVNISAAAVVTTPQEMALIDARKGIEMFNKVNIPVLGIIENMATHICSNCGCEEAIFGAGGAAKMAEHYQVALLASLPLDKQVREHTDAGIPTVVKAPGSPVAQAYIALANKVAAQLWLTNLQAAPMPEIQIVN